MIVFDYLSLYHTVLSSGYPAIHVLLTLFCLFLPCLVLSCFVQCCVALSCSVLGFASIHRLVSHSVFVLPCHIAYLCHCDVCVTIYNARCVVRCVDLVQKPFLSLSVRATTDIDHTLDL